MPMETYLTAMVDWETETLWNCILVAIYKDQAEHRN